MKRSKKIKQLDQRELRACIERLEQLIAGLKSGNIGIEDGAELVSLSPRGPVAFELRVEQLKLKETLRVEMTWRREPASADSRDGALSAPASEQSEAPGASESWAAGDSSASNGSPVTVQSPTEMHASEPPQPSARLEGPGTDEVQRWLSAARVLGKDGHWRLDQDRLIVSLESAGVDALAQQELYTYALQAEADGRSSLLSERLIEAIKRASQPPRSNGVGPATPNGAH